MYRLNNLPRKVLITTDEVIRMGPVEGSVSPDNLEQAIIIAEERFMKKVMCKDFYYAFRDQKNVVVDNINKEYLEGLVNEGNEGEAVVLAVGDMVNAIELVTEANWIEWWKEFGWKILAEAVVYIATPTNWSKYTASGEVQTNPKTIAGLSGNGTASASVELKDVKWKLDKMLMDRLDPLIEASHEWLCDRKTDFPLYNCKSCPCESSSSSGVSVSRKGPWIHGLYDKVDKNNSCCD